MSPRWPPVAGVALLLVWLAVSTCWGQAVRREPYGGYVYPAGCQAGQTVQVTIGGQNLMGCSAGYFTGQGVSARIIEYVRPISKKEQNDLGQRLRVLMRQRWEETMRPGAAKANAAKYAQELAALPPVPKHPWLRNLDNMTLKELNDLRVRLFDPKRQPNSQLAEWVMAEVTVAPAAAAGVRELRLGTPQGLSNPVRFEVGTVAEAVEDEPNPRQTPGPARDLPVVLNGQILPGDTDSFRFKARKGQKLVLQAHARSLIPYLADLQQIGPGLRQLRGQV